VLEVDGHNRQAIGEAMESARQEKTRPTLIIGKTTIAYGSPNKAGSAAAHGAPLGAEEVKLTKKNLGWPEDESFLVPESARAAFGIVGERGRKAQEAWDNTLDEMRKKDADKARLWDAFWLGEAPERIREACRSSKPGKGIATRKSAGDTLKRLMEAVPNLLGGRRTWRARTAWSFRSSGSFRGEPLPDGRFISGCASTRWRRSRTVWRITAGCARSARRSWCSAITCGRRSVWRR
jgi:transketolase